MLSNNLDAVISFIMMSGTAIGAWVAGRKGARSESLNEASQTVQLLRAEIETLKSRLEERDQQIAELRGRLITMEDLVTQRADVDGVRRVVDSIAEKVGADAAA